MNTNTRPVENDSPETQKKSLIEGVSLAIAFLIVGLFLFFKDEYLNNKILTLTICIICFVIAIIGLAIEISKTIDKTVNSNDFFTHLLIGFILLTITYVLHHYIDLWFMNLIGLIVLLLGLYSFLLGLVHFGGYLIEINKKHIGANKIIFLVISQILTLSAALAAIFEALGVKVNILQ
ncbi:hypothetical protein CHN50_20150 [Priestia aryabhattai]|nr:hypothetical protein CHN50_20150 [Priestia aryabhattai]